MQTSRFPILTDGPSPPPPSSSYGALSKDVPVLVTTWHAMIQGLLNESWLLRLTIVLGAVALFAWVARRLVTEWTRRT